MNHSEPSLQLLRSSLAPEYAEASYAELSGIVEAVYGPEATPESVEGLFDDIGRGLSHAAHSVGGFVQQAAPVVARALPNIVQGAASGASVGGPWGALIGGLAGGASGIMQQSSDPTVRGIGGAIHQVGSLAGSIRGGGMGGGGGALGAIGAGQPGQAPGGANLLSSIFGGGAGAQSPAASGGAANGLMGMLTRPETLQALLSAGMGAFGNRSLQIGGQQIPIHSLLAALSMQAGRAAHEAAEHVANAEATPEFALLAGESIGINPESAEGRTDALLTLLALTPSIWASTTRPAAPLTVNVAAPDPAAAQWNFPLTTAPGPAPAPELWPEWPEIEWTESFAAEYDNV